MREDYYADYFHLEDRHWFFVGRRKILLTLLDHHVGPDPRGERRVLDVGCGTGGMLQHLSRYGRVEGVDTDEAAVAFCRSRGLQNVSRAAIPPLPFPDSRFDLVTAFDLLEHVEDDAGTLTEIRRVLAPGGTFLVSVPAYGFLWGDQDRISHHRRRYSAGLLRARIAAAGLRPLRVTYFNTLLFPPIAMVRLARRLLPDRPAPVSDLEMTDTTGATNRLLTRVFSAEASLLRRRDLPFGVSLLATGEAAGGQPS